MLDAAGSIRKIEPDFDAAEMRALGADGRGDSRAEMAGWADVASKFGLDSAKLGDFVHGCVINLFLCVKAGAHGPLMEEMKE